MLPRELGRVTQQGGGTSNRVIGGAGTPCHRDGAHCWPQGLEREPQSTILAGTCEEKSLSELWFLMVNCCFPHPQKDQAGNILI